MQLFEEMNYCPIWKCLKIGSKQNVSKLSNILSDLIIKQPSGQRMFTIFAPNSTIPLNCTTSYSTLSQRDVAGIN